MSIRNRISQFLKSIFCSKGGILLGRVAGPGPAQELTIGSGLQITGTTLSATGGMLPISSKVAVAANMVLDSSHNGKLLEFTGGQTVTLPAPIVGLRCWLAINLGGEVINFAGTHPRIGRGMATTAMQESYGFAELEGCSDYWLLKQITSHSHSISEFSELWTPGDGTGLHELHLNSAGGVCGLLNLWSDAGFKATIYAPLSYTGDRAIELPDADGTLALTSDITPYTSIPASQTGVPVINFAEKGLLYAELTGNTTIAFQNLAPGIVKDVLIWQSAGWGINWPAGIKWVPGSVIPTAVYPVYIRFFSTTSAASGVIAIVLSRNA